MLSKSHRPSERPESFSDFATPYFSVNSVDNGLEKQPRGLFHIGSRAGRCVNAILQRLTAPLFTSLPFAPRRLFYKPLSSGFPLLFSPGLFRLLSHFRRKILGIGQLVSPPISLVLFLVLGLSFSLLLHSAALMIRLAGQLAKQTKMFAVLTLIYLEAS